MQADNSQTIPAHILQALENLTLDTLLAAESVNLLAVNAELLPESCPISSMLPRQ